MADHYYTQNPGAARDERTIDIAVRGISLRLTTDSGVFSKGGLDYGSRFLIECLEWSPGARVLDVGCGYGPIGLAVAKLDPSARVTMLDINERAVELARRNARSNGLPNAEALASDRLSAVAGREFDVVVTNPPIRAGKSVVHAIFEEARDKLVPGGSLWIVIQKKQGAPSAKARLEELYASVEEVGKDKGYRVFKAIK
ncbi:class I SAM-dependent methyltransferase [Paenibacillus thermoaerophilus]|uniref:Class I SAM-dependent methyltransferase n=1 Tax=Paenibacillus thermoaerophilus TaxID=1215385 RepID=A0ABW2V6X7_9BACL|nr:class I SAM-dependent methyltransferase [Paenibacillus thermoaerophilus]TMV10975.1 class I SAM-dependent methyltransferase [Paenibacillus thermoaerophilus]